MRRIALAAGAVLRRGSPHFVRDYDFVVSRLLSKHDFDSAMRCSAGGNYEGVGRIEADILVHLGLRDGQSVIDVGCGSGRLSSAIQRRASIEYLGIDIMQPALDYARKHAPSRYRFARVGGLEIPAEAGSADFVTFFSVVTHLAHHETYLYLEEAKRVSRPGGHIVVSFLELTNPVHWPTFSRTVDSRRRNNRAHLNAFIEPEVFRTWAGRLKLDLVAVHNGGTPWVPLTEPVTMDDGRVFSDIADLGQSVAILRKPS